jgi:phage shock protein C
VDSQWSRSVDGVLAGVCKSLAKRFNADVMLVRLAWVFSVLFFGVGLGAYIVLAIGVPRSDKLAQVYDSRIMGVCSRFARRFDLDPGLTRVGFLTGLFCTGGLVFVAYLILYFVLPKAEELALEKPLGASAQSGPPT